MGFRFQHPWWFLLLVLVAAAGLWAWHWRRGSAVLYSDVRILRTLPKTLAWRIKQALPWVRLLGLVLLVVALARPQRGKEDFVIRSEGIAIQMCIDRSGSMQAEDFQLAGRRVNRLAAVKQVFRDFVAGDDDLPGRPNDLIGLVEFGGYADSKCPLTLDHDALLEVLKTVKIPEPIRDRRGRPINEELLDVEIKTALGDAVALAVDRLKDVKAKSRVVILLSDGANTVEDAVTPAEAAELARKFGIKVYTIGVGSTGMAPFPAVDFFGRQVLRAQPVELDEETLKMMAETTGGRYFNAKSTESLRGVYEEIDRLEKTPTERRLYTEYAEKYQYPMFAGLSLILMEIALTCTWFRSLP